MLFSWFWTREGGRKKGKEQRVAFVTARERAGRRDVFEKGYRKRVFWGVTFVIVRKRERERGGGRGVLCYCVCAKKTEGRRKVV